MNVNIFYILKNIGINELELENKMLFLLLFAKRKIQKKCKKEKISLMFYKKRVVNFTFNHYTKPAHYSADILKRSVFK